IERFVARMLEKDPEKRHKTMNEVKQDLINLREGTGLIPATQAAEHGKRAAGKIKRGMLKLIAVVCLIVAIPVVLTVSLLLNGPAPVKSTIDPLSIGTVPTPGIDRNGDNSLKIQADDTESKTDASLKLEVSAKQIMDPLRLAGKDLTDKG